MHGVIQGRARSTRRFAASDLHCFERQVLSKPQAAGPVRGSEVTADPEDLLLENLRLFQAKHHRWYLDRGQIVSYQLGAQLSASRGCWEHIEIPQRVLYFVTLNAIGVDLRGSRATRPGRGPDSGGRAKLLIALTT